MSFRSKEYYSDWDETGIDLCFWKGYERPDLIIRLLIAFLICFDLYWLSISILYMNTLQKDILMLLLIFILFILFPFGSNLTIMHLEYKRIDVLKYKSIPFLKPILVRENSYYLADFKSASLSKSNLRMSPFYTIKIKFSKPKTTIKIPFRRDLPYRVHYAVYYKFKRKCSDKIVPTTDALRKFYPFFDLKGECKEADFRYLILLACFLAYFIFSLILPTLLD